MGRSIKRLFDGDRNMRYVELFFGILNLGCMMIGSVPLLQMANLLVGTTCITLFVYEQNKKKEQ